MQRFKKTWRAWASWMVFGAVLPSLAFSEARITPIPSLADPAVLKRMIEVYNKKLDLKPSYYSFSKKVLSPEDYQYLVDLLKKTRTTRLPKATITGQVLRFEGGGTVEFKRSPDGQLLVQLESETFKTRSERTLFSDAVKFLRKKGQKGRLSAFVDFLVPDAHAFIAPLLLTGVGGVVYSYRHTLRNAWEDLITPQVDMTKVKYIQEAREHLYSCERDKENWEDNWYEKSWFFGGVDQDVRPSLSTEEGKVKFMNSLSNTDQDIIRATRKSLLECKNTKAPRFEGHEAMVSQDQADASEIRASDLKLVDSMSLEMRDELCKVWDEWDACLNEVKGLKRKYAVQQGMPLSEISQSPNKPVDRAPAIIENPSENGVRDSISSPVSDRGSAVSLPDAGPHSLSSLGLAYPF